ncbi:MAG: tetratricopeptide repeat protein [Anaerolineaceae bacterium]|nr:tetratricopeptide repeat protein [Anaerolineaceae bacterium]
MIELSVFLLGPFTASLGDQPLYKFRTNKVQALLIYLIMEAEQIHRRETLMNILWPDLPQPSAQVNLRQTVYRLRQAIPQVPSKNGRKEVPFLISERQTVQINPEADFFLDVAAFTAQIEHNPAQAVTLYRDDFLSDFYLSDSNEFEAWAQAQRGLLRRQVLDALDTLTENCLQTADYEQAQTYAWKQLEIDKLREGAYRQLMIALMQSGQRSAAIAQYHICRDQLRDELGVEPSSETTTLYQQIQANSLPQEAQPENKLAPVKNGRFHTSLLTDIEGAVQLWERYQQEMIPALYRHNTILNNLIPQHGGRILSLQGDKVSAVFENGRPLACALAIQEAFGKERWGRIGELKVRIGLHGGLSDETAVTQTVAITAAAWGGQILASATVHENLALPDGAYWRDVGKHQLNKEDPPHQLYGLLHPDLPHQSFPPIRAFAHAETKTPPLSATITPPHNLPQQPTPFIGREQELAALDALLADPMGRLISIVGPGGMGKTRLALAIAEKQLANSILFPHGIFFVHLEHIQTADQMIPAIANVLKLPLDSGRQDDHADRLHGESLSAKDQLLDYLRHKQLLLILDNFEHVQEGAGLVGEILQMATQVQILVTSRERLQLREEQIFPIQGLDFPDWETPQEALQYPAVRLFLQAAHRIQPGFALTAADLPELTRICQAVGGMPLGLELTASWVDMLSLSDIADEIQSSLNLLETETRNMPERHRSIRAVFDYSWQQLSPNEQAVFAQLAVFRGGFTRTAAQKIANASLHALVTLVNKSFLRYNQQRDRYELHELVRQYAAEKLAADEVQETAVRTQHSIYYCALLQHRKNQLKAGQPQAALVHIEADQENGRAAWDWAVAQGNITGIDLAISGLCRFYDMRDRVDDGLAICAAASQRLRHLPESPTLQRVLAKTLTWHTRFLRYLGQTETIKNTFQEITTLLEHAEESQEDVRAEKAFALSSMGKFNAFEEENKQCAWEQLEQSLALARQLGDRYGEFSAQNALGNMARRIGNYHEARHRFEKNLNAARSQQNQRETIRALVQLGWVARDLVDYEEARRLFEECLALSQTQENVWGASRALEALAFLTMFQGDFVTAGRTIQHALRISRDNGFRSEMVKQSVNLAVTHWLSGRFADSEDLLKKAKTLGSELGYPFAIAFPTIFHGELLALANQHEVARENIQQGITQIRPDFSSRLFLLGRAYRAMGWLELAAGHFGSAQDWFEQSTEAFHALDDDEAVAWTAAGLGQALYGLGNVEGAQKMVVDALWTAVELQAYISLLFLIPITTLLLNYHKENKRRERFHTLACREPFLANAPFFTKLIWSQLPPLKQAPPVEAENLTGLRRELWTAVSQLLAEDILTRS